MFVLFTDTDTDITPAVAQKYGYKLISMPYVVDGKEIYPYEDFEVFDDHAFYQSLREGTMPQTCALSPEKYKEIFEPYFKNGDEILYVHFSEAMTGTFNAMRLAIEELTALYPQAKFYTIDTKAITILSLNMVLSIGKMYKDGATAQQIIDWANDQVQHHSVYFYADDLKFFQRSGRVSNLAATMGNIMNIHPILHMDSKGTMQTLAKTMGRTKALKKIVELVVEYQDDIKNYPVIVGHTDCMHIAEKLAEMLKNALGEDLNIEFVAVNPTAGSHCGPDTVGVTFHSKRRYN